MLPQPAVQENYYEDSGIRKAVSLIRYCEALQEWVQSCKDMPSNQLKTISQTSKKTLKIIATYLENEIKVLGDDTMTQELQILDKLVSLH